MNALFYKLFHLGDNPQWPDFLRQKLYITNLIGFTLTVLSLVLVVVLNVTTNQLNPSALLGMLVGAFGLLLNWLGYVSASRWLYIIGFPLLLAYESALITPAGNPTPPIRFIILALMVLPPVLFEAKERTSIIIGCLVPVAFFLAFEPLNQLLRVEDGIPTSVEPGFRFVAFTAAIIILLSGVFFLRAVNDRAERQVRGLLHETQQQKAQIQSTLEIVEEQKQEITDSIKYAKRIQQAILPSVRGLDQFPLEHFILFKPRDIVSGDFYWYNATPGVLRIAAADCTGHGVPGAFMSMLGNTLLNQIATTQRNADAVTTLEVLNASVTRALQQDKESQSENERRMGPMDGMDIALVHFHFEERKAYFSGAQRPFWLVRNKELTEIRGSKRGIGGLVFGSEKPFELHEVELQPGDRVYLFSDGMPDQVGGENRRKLTPKVFGEWLCETANMPLEGQARELERRLLEWQGSHEQMDDQLLIGIAIR
jgi:serine phosphatase RsbU (regulator of sigma subunit)